MKTTEVPTPQIAEAVAAFKAALIDVDRQLRDTDLGDTSAQSTVSAACASLSRTLDEHATLGGHAADVAGSYVFAETFAFFLLSRVLERAFTKPRGYAGDYYTMELVYQNEAEGRGRLGRFIDRWALDLPSSQAVRNRRRMIARTIEDVKAWPVDGLLVTSLASGSARELFDIVPSASGSVRHATCIDLDAEALSYSSARAKAIGVSDSMTFVRDNVVDLAAGSEKADVPPQDLIYSLGLIDYLEDAEVAALIDWMFEHLKPGGLAVLGNFDASNPDRSFLTHVLEWPLVYRTEEELRTLLAQSKFGRESLDIRHEEAQVQLFAFANRGG